MSQTEDERLIDACEDGGPSGRTAGHQLMAQRDDARLQLSSGVPIPMRLPCPTCGALHIDVGRFGTQPHHTHACQHCGAVWRPALVNTVGVRFLPGFKNEEEG